jgi:hypothetical protein
MRLKEEMYMMTTIVIGTALGAIAIFASRKVQRQLPARAVIGRDIFITSKGDRGVLSCFEIPEIPSLRDEREK